MTSYAPVDSRSPRGMSPLHSPSYAASASGSSETANNNPYMQSSGQHDGSIQRHFNGAPGAPGVGGRELGPYASLNNRRMNGSSSYEDDRRSLNSSAERLINSSEGGGGLGGPTMAGVQGGAMVDMRGPEPDDFLHDPKGADGHSSAISLRGALNVLTLMILVAGLVMLFGGYPVIYHFLSQSEGNKGGFNLGGTNGTGQVASLSAVRSMIDTDTPASAHTFTSTVNDKTYNLQFSDEFETEGRTFWPGDDQYWEAVDIWYGGTVDYEWYSPENANTTGGALVLTMTDKPSHNLNFQSSMIQSWNKLCFQGGYIEFSIIQPGSHSTSGYWPAAWMMGNLGRPGYLASTDGMWPYSYQGCDTGILPNQTNAQGGPIEAVESTGQYADNGQLSKLPGMRTPSCTCSGEDHPGPKNSVGRSAPELDVLEAQIQSRAGVKNSYASQSLQTAPYDDAYYWVNSTPATTIIGDNTRINTYVGGPYQEAVSSVSLIPQRGFMDYDAPDTEKWVTFGVEIEPDYNNDGSGFVTWYVDGQATWTITGDTVPASSVMEISRRNIPTEPMSIIMNLGMSSGFQTVDFDAGGVAFPAQMKFDYVRIYQEKGKEKMSCDPADHPTSDYITNHMEAYTNPNLTTWNATQWTWPKNSLKTGC